MVSIYEALVTLHDSRVSIRNSRVRLFHYTMSLYEPWSSSLLWLQDGSLWFQDEPLWLQGESLWLQGESLWLQNGPRWHGGEPLNFEDEHDCGVTELRCDYLPLPAGRLWFRGDHQWPQNVFYDSWMKLYTSGEILYCSRKKCNLQVELLNRIVVKTSKGRLL